MIGSFYDDSMALHDDDDNLQLLTNRGQIAGRYDRNGTNPSLATADTAGIPLHRPSSQPQSGKSKKKKFDIKDTFNRILGRTNAASGNAGEGGERIIYVNNSELNDQQKFLHNRVFTAKYTAFTFLFKFLYEEFSKYANLFFLFISGIQVKHSLFMYSLAVLSFRFIFILSKFLVSHLHLDSQPWFLWSLYYSSQPSKKSWKIG